MSIKPSVLVVVPYYLPGVKSGGPIRSIANFAAALGEEMDIRIITADRDAGDTEPYPGVTRGDWIRHERASVMYLPPAQQGLAGWLSLLKQEKADYLYINSFFAREFSMLPILARVLGARGQENLVIAPRGQFAPAALAFKSWWKRMFLASARLLPVYRRATWQSTSVHELADMRRALGEEVRICEALAFGGTASAAAGERPPKSPGSLKIAFLGRITPMKNLRGALRMLRHARGNIELTIYGPISDRAYWDECQDEMKRLPENVRVIAEGLVDHDKVQTMLGKHHLFFLPTLGENFGHVIDDALRAGCITLISDRTPWRGLAAAGAGWDLPLEDEAAFQLALTQCVAMDQTEFDRRSTCARAYVEQVTDMETIRAQYRTLFGIATSR